MATYNTIRTISAKGIRGKDLPGAAAYLANEELQDVEPNRTVDDQLLAASIKTDDAAPLLCLRCRISHPLEAWIRALHGKFKDSYDLDLTAMASYGLDDSGSTTLLLTRDNTPKPFTYSELDQLPSGRVNPFSAEVLRTYDSERCGLPHWARQKIQCHKELKTYLKEEGLLMISDWALLADTSPTRIRESWQTCGDGVFPLEELLDLHQRYRALYREAMSAYRQRTGKGSGWLPELNFYQALKPDQTSYKTEEQLKALASAVRKLISGRWMITSTEAIENSLDGPDPASFATNNEPTDEPDRKGMRQQIDVALQRAITAYMPAEMDKEAKKFAKTPERQLAWQLYGEGMSQREIGPHCGHKQAWVSKLLDEKRRSIAIATAAALELKRTLVFSQLMTSVEGTERLLEALRNHLVEPERNKDDAPLRLWVHNYLQQI